MRRVARCSDADYRARGACAFDFLQAYWLIFHAVVFSISPLSFRWGHWFSISSIISFDFSTVDYFSIFFDAAEAIFPFLRFLDFFIDGKYFFVKFLMIVADASMKMWFSDKMRDDVDRGFDFQLMISRVAWLIFTLSFLRLITSFSITASRLRRDFLDFSASRWCFSSSWLMPMMP